MVACDEDDRRMLKPTKLAANRGEHRSCGRSTGTGNGDAGDSNAGAATVQGQTGGQIKGITREPAANVW